MLYPIMPTAALEIWSQLGLANSGSPAQSDPATLKWGELSQGEAIGEVKALFPRIDKGKTMAEINGQGRGQEAAAGGRSEPDSSQVQSTTSVVKRPELTGTAGVPPAVSAQREPGELPHGVHATEADAVPASPNAPQTQPPPPMHHATEADAVQGAEGVTSFIDITDFAKVELRVGEVLTAARIPKADKLLLLSVDVGEEKPRQILAGIAQYYEPEQLLGRKIAVVANLKPRKMRGYESQGMLLAASVGDEGKPVIATFTEDVPNGARLK
jgi:methionyl-tRNA synthetase